MDSRQKNKLGKYSLVAEIARGGMGIVYLATSGGIAGFKKLVVVKELKPDLSDDEKFLDMFLDEARLAARLNHRNIVQTIEVDQDDGHYFFVMEYLEGRTLHAVSRLKGKKALSDVTFLKIISEMLAGLHYAHELTDFDGKPLNVIHRDVGPRNVMITYDGQVKLLDFGVAKAANRDQETEAGELKGRVPYMAPEHVSEKSIDRRADIFSVGVLMRELLTKKRVWEGFNEVEILRELLQLRVPAIPDDADISEEARDILTKAMAPEREQRYKTALEMREALERHIARIDDDSMPLAKVGDHIAREFAEHRAQIKMMVEQHVARAESVPPIREPLPTLPMSSPDLSAATPSGTSVSAPSARGSDPSSPSNPSAPSAPSNPSTPSSLSKPSGVAAPSSSPVVAAAVAPKDQTPTQVLAASQAAIRAQQEEPQRKSISLPPVRKTGPLTYVFYALFFIAAAAGLTLAIRAANDTEPARPNIEPTSSPPTEVTRRPAATVDAAPAEPKDDLIEVTIRALPPIATIYVDDVSVGQGPHTQKYVRGRKHVIRASAPGYVTKTETVEMSAAMMVNIVLEREAGTVKGH